MIALEAPKLWTETRLDEVADIVRDIVDPFNIANGTTYVGLEHMESSGDFVGVGPVSNGELASAKFRFSPEHVLFGKLRPYLRKVARPTFSGVCSTDILPIKPKPGISRDYLYHYLRHPRITEEATLRCAGANLPRLSPSQLESFPFLVPFPDDARRSLAEQKRIAAILDKADAIRRRRQEAARFAYTLIPNLYFELFGDPLANNRKWPTAKVETLCDLVRGSSPRPRSDPSFYGGPIPRLMIEDITRDGKYVTPQIDTLTELGATMSRPVVAGTVVMAVSGNVGLVARVLVDACIHDGFVGFKDLDTKAVRADYFMWTLDLLKASHSKRKAGAIWQNLTTHQVKAMDIPLPPPTLQDRFEKLSKRLVDFAQSYTTRVEEVDGLFNALVQRAFRGEL